VTAPSSHCPIRRSGGRLALASTAAAVLTVAGVSGCTADPGAGFRSTDNATTGRILVNEGR